MSKNTNLSFLTDFITADIVNSRVGINNASPQTTFDVTGTGKFSGILTLGSTISNGTYAYTLPSATGTLALTSDIPSVTGYVPYTGATQAVNLGYNSLSASFLRIDGAGPTLGSYLGFKHSTNVTTGADGYTSIYTFGTNTIAFKSVSGATTRDFSFSMASITPGVPGGRTYTLPDADGTIALTSNIPANPVGGTGTTNYLPKFTGASTIANSNLINDASGNLGLGVTPSVWASGTEAALQVGNTSIYKYSTYETGYSVNAYFNAGWKYISNDIASQYKQSSGAHYWYYAPSGTAGNAISFTQAMTLTSGGNLLVGTTTDNGARLQVSGTARVSDSITIGPTDSVWNLTTSNKLQLQNSLLIGYTTTGTFLTMNLNFNGTWKYISNGFASLYSQDSGDHIFFTSTSSTSGANATLNEKLRITNSGNVGIGTSSPSEILHVYKATTFATILLQNGNNSAYSLYQAKTGNSDTWQWGCWNDNSYRVGKSGIADYLMISSSGNVLIGTTTDSGSKLQVAGNLKSATLLVNNFDNNQTIVGIGNRSWWTGGASDNDAAIGTYSPNMCFFTANSGTERMRITSGGVLKASNAGNYASSTSDYHELRQGLTNTNIALFTHIGASPYGPEIGFSSSPNNSTNYFLICKAVGASMFIVYSNGNVVNQNGSYGAISDAKLKENIEDASPKLDDLMKVKIRNYNLIGDEKKQIGVIAQELEEIFPAMIDESPDRDKDGNDLGTTTKSVKYSVFVPMLIKAIQEQQQQIDKLKNV